MLELILVIIALSFLVWKKVKKLNVEDFPVAQRRLNYLPIVQFLLCAFFCLLSLRLNGDLPKDEINQFIEEHEFVGDLSSALLGLDLTADQVTMYRLTENLHSKATYILIGSFIMMLVQIVGASTMKLNRLIIEGIAILHTISIYFIGNLLEKTFSYMLNQIGTIKIVNLLREDDSFFTWGMIAVFILPFHYLYHYVLAKYYTEEY